MNRVATILSGALFIGAALSSRPGKLVWFCVAATVAAQLIVWYRMRVLSALPALRFDEEDPQAIFQGFQLSEGLAALPKPATPLTASPEFRAAPSP